MTETYFSLFVIPGSDEVYRDEQYTFNWEQSPFSEYIGGELFAFITDDDEDEYNEVGTTIVSALRERPTKVYGNLGILRAHGEALDELDIAFVEALASDPDTVSELMPPAGGINLIATTLDWRTLVTESIPVEGSAETPEWALEGVPYVDTGFLLLDNHTGERKRVALVERESIEVKHLHGYLDDRFGHTGGRRLPVKEAAHAYRESEHWRLSTWTRILTAASSEESMTLMLKSAAEGVPEEYLFAAMG